MSLGKVWITRRDKETGRPLEWGRSETAGKKYQPWEIAKALDDAHFSGTAVELAEFVATSLAESNGYSHARLVYTTEQGVPLGWDGKPVRVVAAQTPAPTARAEPSAYDRSVRWKSDRGPFQFSSVGVTDTEAANLDKAAVLAVDYWRRRGFQPWAAHNSGRHLPRMREAIKGVANYLARKYEVRPFWC